MRLELGKGLLDRVEIGAVGRQEEEPALSLLQGFGSAAALREFGFHNIAVVPLGTDMRPAGAIPSPGRQLLFAGRLLPMKGCAWFIREVLPLLADDITLRVAGTMWNAGERAALDHPRVTYLGRLSGDALAREYVAALAVVVPNIDVPTREFEGFGLAALEAAGAGGVVLAAAHSGLRDAVIDGTTGYLIAPGDAQAWAAKIRIVEGWTPPVRQAFIAEAIAAVRSRFSWAATVTATYRTYGIGAR